MTVFELKKDVKASLSSQYPAGEIEGFIRIIFEHLKGWSAVDVALHRDYELSDFICDKAKKIVDRLKMSEPIQYIVGTSRFYGSSFKVSPATLIPRRETEELVDMIVNENRQTDLSVLDIGTGSGCIAIALSRNLKFAQVEAVDISAEALAIAKENATSLKASVKFKEADIFKFQPTEAAYDIIVSNPPYIAEFEKKDMDRNVLDYEPHTALFVPNSDPVCFYRRIADFADVALKSGGRLYFEINPLYADDVCNLLNNKSFVDVESVLDIDGRKRFIKTQKKKYCQ